MSKVFSAHAVSVDGCISGRDPRDDSGGFGRGLGDAPMLFDGEALPAPGVTHLHYEVIR